MNDYIPEEYSKVIKSLEPIVEKYGLDSFYYACSYAKADCLRFMNVTAAMALKIIPQNLTSQPVFLCIDVNCTLCQGQIF